MKQLTIARGALYGALIGDAAGATLEFLGRKPTAAEIREALQMVGGGCWGTAPGQITDDGELTLALAYSLIGRSAYSADHAAQEYLQWYASAPFDVGATTRTAFAIEVPAGNSAAAAVWAAASVSVTSKANGALMRASPLGIWGVRLSASELQQAAFDDTGLSHPAASCRYATAAYVIAIRHLMLCPGDADGAMEAAAAVLTAEAAAEVAGWLAEAEAGVDPGATPLDGFVRYGFIHAFRHLKLRSTYEDALTATMSGGGDTDTNACIVGGLIGALHGEHGIPGAMRRALLGCDTQQGRPRPARYHTTRLDELIRQLVG